jgi:DNA gyrase subunit B
MVFFSVYAIIIGMIEQFAVASGTLPGANVEYTAKDLEHISDQEHVRKRPAMHIGDTTSRGLHQLVSEVVDNVIGLHGVGVGFTCS